TQMARTMVTRWGMGERVGIVLLGHGDQRDVASSPACSDETAAHIDREVAAIVEQAYQLASSVLSQRRQTLDSVTERLLQVETLGADELAPPASQAGGPASGGPPAGSPAGR